jgi:hypothetical protein
MSRADFIYAISYPTYGGYRVEHDPAIMIFYSGEVVPEFPMPMLFAALMVVTTLIAVSAKLTSFKRRQEIQI